mmetsp:Transcript_47754/g.112701  ORF Transcript_47754/g.112701 Transcript_47754/m.112701 type:complete len:161 (+) Transcript_47754:45-527(+)
MEGSLELAKERIEEERKISISQAELHAARESYFQALDSNEDVVKKKYTYAWCLVHQNAKQDIQQGIPFLFDLADEKAVQKEALYCLATAQYILEQYTECRLSLKRLLAIEPHDTKAQDLKALVEDVLRREGALGLAVFSGAVAAGGAAAFAFGLALLRKR